jgi:hypothetical protein
MLVKELVYFILDSVKLISDDSIITEDHILFLAKKYRSLLIRKEQERERSTTGEASEFEYQQICLSLEKVPAIDGEPCTGGYYLRTKERIPKLLDGNLPRVYPMDFYQGINVVYVPRDRMRYIGTNRFLQNIIYVSLGPDQHLYLNSSNPQFMYLKKLRMLGGFEDFDEASNLLCDSDGEDASCDVLEMRFPIREYLIPTLIELCVKDITGAAYKPSDNHNNAHDDLADIASFIRRNTNSNPQQ